MLKVSYQWRKPERLVQSLRGIEKLWPMFPPLQATKIEKQILVSSTLTSASITLKTQDHLFLIRNFQTSSALGRKRSEISSAFVPFGLSLYMLECDQLWGEKTGWGRPGAGKGDRERLEGSWMTYKTCGFTEVNLRCGMRGAPRRWTGDAQIINSALCSRELVRLLFRSPKLPGMYSRMSRLESISKPGKRARRICWNSGNPGHKGMLLAPHIWMIIWCQAPRKLYLHCLT